MSSDGETVEEGCLDSHEESYPQEEEQRPEEQVRQTSQPSWSKMPGEGGRKRGPQCDYQLYRGKNVGSRCPRNGLHPKEGKLYCTNHFRILTQRAEQVQMRMDRKRKQPEQPAQEERPIMEEYDEEEVMDQNEEQPQYEEEREQPEYEEPPAKRVRQLGLQEQERNVQSQDGLKEMQRRAIGKKLRKKMKTKYREKYAKKPVAGSLVWDTFKYKNPRKTLNRAFKHGGGVSSMFHLPRE